MSAYTIGVVGALGVVGGTMLEVLEQRKFPIRELIPLDARENEGKEISFMGEKLRVREAKKGAFAEMDAALFAVGAEASLALAPAAVSEGCVVVDNSSAFRMEKDVPLVVPEVNPGAVLRHKGIIANPNCSTVIALLPIKPLHDYAGVKRVIASTYQAVSGAGIAGLRELEAQTRDVLEGRAPEPKAFAHRIAFNLIPHIDFFEDNAYTHEEMKLVRESRKILDAPELMVNCTCVRVPVYCSHSESITIETERELTPEKARELLAKAPGVRVADDPARLLYPMPVDTSGQDLVFVGRIRRDISTDRPSLSFWCCGDQLRKGAATNAVQILEILAASSARSTSPAR